MKTNLLFGIHCHQPIDNFDSVVYEIIEKSYEPFFTILKQYPTFKCSVHFSGWLLEFIKKNRPSLFALIQELSPQLEFFTGGYYEPILASIPSCDRIAQINKLTNFIKKNFNQTPKGLWLTERIWDDSIIDDLHICNIEYVIVDDYHLIAAGHDTKNLNGYFISENSNHTIALFPINKALRYVIPFASVEKTQQTLHSIRNKAGQNAAIIFDDGEKFGVWPKTYEKVYEQEWLKNFFETTLSDETIDVLTFNEYYTQNKAIDLAYIPTVSYHEMQEWSILPNLAQDYKELVQTVPELEHLIRGGIWKNFFLKYNESNWIHKRSLELSKTNAASAKFKKALYKTQCNDVLWHGIFGGIYLPNLRDNAYRYIIECENLLDSPIGMQKKDINLNSYEEYKFLTKELIVILDCKNGGQIVELDLREDRFNLQNTLTRYKEIYHSNIVKEEQTSLVETQEESPNIHDNILTTHEDLDFHVDWYLKKSAIDHITDCSFSLKTFEANSFIEYSDFTNQPFTVVNTSDKSLALERNGGIYLEKKYPTSLKKEFEFNKNAIQSTINIETSFEKPLLYVLEWNLHFNDYDSLLINNCHIHDSLEFCTLKLVIKDKSLNKKISFTFEKEVTVYVCKIKSVSQSEAGVDYTTQGLSFAFVQPLDKALRSCYTFKCV
ncbi:MAG: alpha-amylase/4-alpha-glucanotransferase domain-containing protein [Arcobacteraceae bacterium]